MADHPMTVVPLGAGYAIQIEHGGSLTELVALPSGFPRQFPSRDAAEAHISKLRNLEKARTRKASEPMPDQLAPLQQFEYLPGMNLRVLQRDGEPWFVATDVGKALGLGNMHSSLTALDRTEKGLHSMETPSGNQKTSIISESGLYLLVLKSRKEEAKAFQKWVTGEVLPSIRKTGGAYRYAGTGIPLGRPPSDSPL